MSLVIEVLVWLVAELAVYFRLLRYAATVVVIFALWAFGALAYPSGWLVAGLVIIALVVVEWMSHGDEKQPR